MNRLIPIRSRKDIPSVYRNTPWVFCSNTTILDALLMNGRSTALIGMCMDNRKRLRIPDNFAFILRAAEPISEIQVSGRLRDCGRRRAR
jgi:carbonic anhydrase